MLYCCACVVLPCPSFTDAGLGEEVDCVMPKSSDEVLHNCEDHNNALLRQIKADPFGNELLRLTAEDAKLKRMSPPVPGKKRMHSCAVSMGCCACSGKLKNVT